MPPHSSRTDDRAVRGVVVRSPGRRRRPCHRPGVPDRVGDQVGQRPVQLAPVARHGAAPDRSDRAAEHPARRPAAPARPRSRRPDRRGRSVRWRPRASPAWIRESSNRSSTIVGQPIDVGADLLVVQLRDRRPPRPRAPRPSPAARPAGCAGRGSTQATSSRRDDSSARSRSRDSASRRAVPASSLAHVARSSAVSSGRRDRAPGPGQSSATARVHATGCPSAKPSAAGRRGQRPPSARRPERPR